jgi:para-aminobenzoate synthetase component 1
LQNITAIAKSIEFKDPLLYFKICKNINNIVFFDSVTQHNDLGRYSFIAIDPDYTLTVKDKHLKKNSKTITDKSIWECIRNAPDIKPISYLPPFQGGFAGFFSYDLAREIEVLPKISSDNLGCDDIAIGYYNLVISFDNKLKKAWIVATGYREDSQCCQKYANSRIKWLLEYIKDHQDYKECSVVPIKIENIETNFSKKSYIKAVQKAKDYILEGDIFEVNLAQQFLGKIISGSNIDLYVKLRLANSAPFCAYSNIGNTTILSTSPERFIKLNQEIIEARPIKGTIKRSVIKEEDLENAKILVNSSKDRAENVMIVDLMRNDLSKVAELGSVSVLKLCGLESYKNVHHLVSVIQAKLSPQHDIVSLLKSCFPGGSITGAPKIRAMEIIDEIEGVRRGPYCGSIGYISGKSHMDLSILIRTIVIKDDNISIHSGGAITLDSDPEQEYAETMTKVETLLNVVNE